MIRGIFLAHADYRGLIDRSSNYGFRIRSLSDRMGSGIPPRSTYCWVPPTSYRRDRSRYRRLSASHVLFGKHHHCECVDDYWDEVQDYQESAEKDVDPKGILLGRL